MPSFESVQHGWVIHDVDRSLASWLARCLPTGVAVRLRSPQPDWLTERPEPLLVNAFLYDIREDTRLLASDATPLRDTDGHATARRAPVRRYRLRYLLTAWADDDLAEHELLGAVLRGAVSLLTIPPDCLVGSLAAAGELVPMRCAPVGEQPVGAQLCTHLGLPPRTTLDLVVTAPLVPELVTDLAPAPSGVDLNTNRPGSLRRSPVPTNGGERPRRITERP